LITQLILASLFVRPFGPPIKSEPTLTKVRFDRYEATLRVPDEGIFAGEEIDVEYRVVDTTQKDPVEDGFKGVGGIEATAKITMPSMQGMPAALPKVHREGVPGDYGIEAYFPHGGGYQIDLDLRFPSGERHPVRFLVDVRDERKKPATRREPYLLKITGGPKNVLAKALIPLQMQIVDRKTGLPTTSFDTAHEKKFHLLIASKDLNWFLHEHPTMDAGGNWSVPIRFPAGGDYWVYADVAPSGQGSRVLISKYTVSGPKPTWDTRLLRSTKAVDGGLRGELSTLEPIVIGMRATLQVKLFDAKTGKPAGDTLPWLGAAGHMMIFHRDGQTVVHSHPAEDKESAALVKRGIVRFSGRFPRPGRYKVYAQFDWRGKVRTLGFTIEVKE
jgi:hypothetical protein